jgi:hypothetical protein
VRDKKIETRKQILFEGERILLRRIIGKGYLIAQFIDGKYCNNSILHTIKLKSEIYDSKYVLGILNSKLIGCFFIQKYARDEKTFPEIRIHELGMLPIKRFKNQSILIEFTKKVISLKS